MEAWSHSSPSVQKWTKHTVAAHLTLGGLGATAVGSPLQIADELERWVEEADVDGFNFVSINKALIEKKKNLTGVNFLTNHPGIRPIPLLFPRHCKSPPARTAQAGVILVRLRRS